MGPLKLFVSHSSKTDKNRAFLGQVCQTLGQERSRFHVLVDQSGEIPVGEEWFRYLSEWMAECDAAVILFSRAAFEDSEWVRAEAAILSWRKRIQPDFKLVGVLLDDVQPQEFDDDAFFNVIRIGDFQFVRDCRCQEEMLEKIGAAFEGMARETSPFENLVRLMQEILQTVVKSAGEEPLQRVWEDLNGPSKPYPGKDFADSLARMLLRERKSVFIRLKQVIEGLRNVLGQDRAVKMIEMTKGLWVESESAGAFSSASHQYPAVVLHGGHVEQFTAPCYLRRCWPYPKELVLTTAGDLRTLWDLQSLLCQYFDSETEDQPDIELLDDILAEYDTPIFVLFILQDDNELPDEDFLKSLHERYRNVKLLIGARHEIEPPLGYLYSVEPKPEPDDERKQRALFQVAKRLAENI